MIFCEMHGADIVFETVRCPACAQVELLNDEIFNLKNVRDDLIEKLAEVSDELERMRKGED